MTTIAFGVVLFASAFLIGYLADKAIRVFVTKQPWYPRMDRKENRDVELAQIERLTRAGVFTQQQAYDQYEMAVGCSVMLDNDYIHRLGDAWLAHAKEEIDNDLRARLREINGGEAA